MPSQTRHLAAARRFEELARRIAELEDGPAWAIVLGFYAALHLVDAYLARQNIHPESHVERERFLTTSSLRAVRQEYLALRNRSEDSRYEGREFTEAQARIALEFDLQRIRRSVERLLLS